MVDILIAYSTTDGHTRTICERIRQVLERQGHRATLVSIAEDPNVDLQPFDKIVIGASIRYGKHRPAVADFIRRNERLLDARPNAFFSVNIVARKPDKNSPATNPYLRKFLKRITWRPRELAVFAGRLEYPRYGFFDRSMIRLIMLMTKGPTDPNTVIEYTDWQQVEAFARRIGEM
jgi:menaquinone-dependent protoporphyrinogen oxidase